MSAAKSGKKRKSGKNIPITFRWRREIQDYEWDRKIRRYVMAVAFILERHADADGKNVYPSVGTIADLAGIGLPKVREALKAMEDAGFIRTYGKTRYGTKLRRLVYKDHDIEVDDARSTSKSETRSTTKRTQGTLGKSPTRTESLSRSAKSPKATIAPRSATPKPIISAPNVEGDLVVMERKEHSASGRSNLRTLQARAKSVVSKSDAQLAAEWQIIERRVDLIVSEFIDGYLVDQSEWYETWGYKDKEVEIMFEAVCNDGDLFSLLCRNIQPFDAKEWYLFTSLMKQPRMMNHAQNETMKAFWTSTAVRAFEMFIDAIRRHPDLFIQGNIGQEGKTDDLGSLTVAQIRERFYLVSRLAVKDIREVQRREYFARFAKSDAESQAREASANADAVSPSATRTSGDEMIVGKIVESVETSSTLERW